MPISLTERAALRVIRLQPSIAPVAPADDPVHLLNPDERKALRRIESSAIVRAAVAGALSALASAVTALAAHVSHPVDGINVSVHNLVNYWGWVGLVTLVASIFEIAFLYWDALRSVHRMACAAGLSLDSEDPAGVDAAVISALVRAAMELPNPPRPLAGINPRRETKAIFAIFASLLYKAKVALTTFVLKALIRGALGRIAARAVLELVSVPVTALWNAIVCHRVLAEARLRILGPSAVVELLEAGLSSSCVSRAGLRVAVRAVASAVVRTRDFHPNHLALIHTLCKEAPLSEVDEPDDTQRFLYELGKLTAADQTFVLYVLVTASILDGRLTRRERRLLDEAFRACERTIQPSRVSSLMKAFRSGKPVTSALIAVVG